MPINNYKPFRRPPGRQQGQAIVEGAAIVGVLLLAFYGITYLGKFHDVQTSTIQAARYAAWERAALPDSYADADLESQTRSRLYQWNGGGLASVDGVTDAQEWAAQSSNWKDHGGKQRLVDKAVDVSVITTPGGAGAGGSSVKGTAAHQGMLHAASIALRDLCSCGHNPPNPPKPPVPTPGPTPIPAPGPASPQIYLSQVSVKLNDIQALPAPLNTLGLTLTESSMLLTE